MDFKYYEVNGFNTKYNTKITKGMDLNEVEKELNKKFELVFISRDSDAVLKDCENLLRDESKECDLVNLEGDKFFAFLN